MWMPDELEALRRATEDKEFQDTAHQRERDRADQMDAMRYAFEKIEEREEAKRRAVIIGTGRRNGKDLDFQIAQLAAAAGITAEELDEVLRRVGELISQAAAAAAELLNTMIQTINDVYAPGLAAAWEEIQKLMEQYEDVDEPEEEDRHDGAVEVLVTWLLPVPTLYELYGQGVDHGGPGPSRLTLTRVTDDGLRRAETGRNRKGEHAMIIFANVLLGIAAGTLFLGVIGEKDKEKHRDVTLCFVATMATIVLLNVLA